MKCSNCGYQLAEGARFCANCGTPVNNAQQTNSFPQYVAPQPVKLIMKQNFTFSTYSYDVVDVYGNFLYKVKNANTAFSYGAHVVDANGYELLNLKQVGRSSWMTMKFDLFRGNQFISQVNQELSGSHYNYVLPELGIVAQSDAFGVDTNIYRNNQLVATTSRNKAFSDQYEVILYDPQIVDIVLIIVMAMQICIGRSRRR